MILYAENFSKKSASGSSRIKFNFGSVTESKKRFLPYSLCHTKRGYFMRSLSQARYTIG